MRGIIALLLLATAGTVTAAPLTPAGQQVGFAVSVPFGGPEESAAPLTGPASPITAGDIANNAMGGWLGIGILVAAGGVLLYQEMEGNGTDTSTD